MNADFIESLTADDTQNAVAAFLRWFKEASQAQSVALYFLSTSQNEYFQIGLGESSIRVIKPSQIPNENEAILVKRQDCILAFLKFGALPNGIDADTRRLAAATIENIHARYGQTNFLHEIRQPIDFTDTENYFQNLAQLLAQTLNMQMVAIRRLDAHEKHDDLKCLAFHVSSTHSASSVDFLNGTIPPPFQQVIADTRNALDATHNVPQIEPKYFVPDESADFDFLKSNELLKDVKTFVVFPVIDGKELFSLISCASNSFYQFSSTEKNSIEAVMQICGVAIGNFRKYQELDAVSDQITDQLMDMTALEIAQSVRHSLQNSNSGLSLWSIKLKRAIAKKSIPDISQVFSEFDEVQHLLTQDINRLRFSGPNSGEQKLVQTSIKAIWEHAVTLIEPRLKGVDVKSRPSYDGPELRGFFYQDWLRDAFLNLLLNSLDAFEKSNRPKHSRAIVLTAERDSDSEIRYKLNYRDNAGGLDKHHLTSRLPEKIRKLYADIPLDQLIFKPKVTSKVGKKGSGWGLYLVRRAIELHKGSVYLASTSADGCSFRIEILKNLENQ